MEVVKELVSFLNNPNPQVRQAAVQGLSAYTADKQFRLRVSKFNVVSPLMRLLGDISVVAYHAVVCLINLSEEEDLVNSMLASNIVVILVDCIVENEGKSLIDLYASLLSNLTLHEAGCAKLDDISPEKVSRLVLHLLESFVSDMEKHPGVGMALVNITQLDSARTVLLGVHNPTSKLPLLYLFGGVSCPSVSVRRNTLSIIRNCSFNNSLHSTLVRHGILVLLLEPLRGFEQLSAKDISDMPATLHTPRTREQDPACKQLIIETLILFSHHREIRDNMRAIKAYPIIRDWEREETNDVTKESIYRLVELLISEEEVQTPTTTPLK